MIMPMISSMIVTPSCREIMQRSSTATKKGRNLRSAPWNKPLRADARIAETRLDRGRVRGACNPDNRRRAGAVERNPHAGTGERGCADRDHAAGARYE